MKFIVTRTSLHDRTKQPDLNCYSEIVAYSERWVVHPKESREKVRRRIIDLGFEIIEAHDFYFIVLKEEQAWFIDLNSLDELLQFGDSELIITAPFKDYIEYPNITMLEIYDDYRE